ncbi:MAG TPA: hypothetical protein VIK81_04940 [Patescibacteria group bacterium]
MKEISRREVLGKIGLALAFMSFTACRDKNLPVATPTFEPNLPPTITIFGKIISRDKISEEKVPEGINSVPLAKDTKSLINKLIENELIPKVEANPNLYARLECSSEVLRFVSRGDLFGELINSCRKLPVDQRDECKMQIAKYRELAQRDVGPIPEFSQLWEIPENLKIISSN